MARSIRFVALAVLATSLTVCASRRAILSEAGGAQYDLGDVQGMHRHLMSSLKEAQESAGIFVEDTHLFEGALNNGGRRLQQATADPSALFQNPDVFASLLSLVSQGLNVGSFPGAALNLPGGSAFGYAPTDNSYCLFATTPYTAPAPAPLVAGSPLPAAGPPSQFACVAASSNPPATPGSFSVTLGGEAYICVDNVPTGGRKLQQAPSPVDTAIGNALISVGLPIWNCVVSTTPAGNTTLGQATLAVLNDLGVVAEHLLVYLNADGALTYEEDIKNDFVSLTNPLYPTGPRLNFSIDFATVAKEDPILKEIFGKTPPTPPTPAPTTAPVSPPSPTTPDTNAPPQSGGDSGSSGSPPSGGDSGAQSSTTTPSPPSPPSPPGSPPTPAPPSTTTLTAFDGYIDNCQAVIGSYPHTDGNFDRNNNFSTTIVDGAVLVPISTIDSFAGNVVYVIPASKSSPYAPLTASSRKTAQFCYDIASLQPVYNPLATYITSGALTISANPLTTVAAFGNAYGMSAEALVTALVVVLPAGESLWSYDALAAAATGDATGLAVLKKNVQTNNLITSGADLLTNDTTVYASYAILMNQAIAKKVLYSPPAGAPSSGRRLLQATPAVDLTNATTLASILTIAAQSAPAQSDEATRAALNQGLSGDEILAVSQAVANLNSVAASATDAATLQKVQYYSATQLAPAVQDLADGGLSIAAFNAATTATAISSSLAKTTLPGSVVPQTTAATPPSITSTATQASESSSSGSSSSSSGLSHGGKVALATVLPIVGVIAIVAAVAFFISRRNSNGGAVEGNDVWWRRPFGGASQTAAPASV